MAIASLINYPYIYSLHSVKLYIQADAEAKRALLEGALLG